MNIIKASKTGYMKLEASG